MRDAKKERFRSRVPKLAGRSRNHRVKNCEIGGNQQRWEEAGIDGYGRQVVWTRLSPPIHLQLFNV